MLAKEVLEALSADLTDLADELGVSYSSLKKWKTGERTPSTENLRKLADAADDRGSELLVLAKRLQLAADEER